MILELTRLLVLPSPQTSPPFPSSSSTPLSPSISHNHNHILTALQTVRTLLTSSGHPTHSRFYRSPSNPATIYIFGAWQTVAEHRLFLESEACREILAPQEGVLGWDWSGHLVMDEVGGGDGNWAHGWGVNAVIGILRVKSFNGGNGGVVGIGEDILRRSVAGYDIVILLSGQVVGLDGVVVGGEEVVIFQAGKEEGEEGKWWVEWEEEVRKIELEREGVVVLEARGVRDMER